MTNIPEKILSKLKKLLALEKGAREIGSIHEAETAAQAAQQLILQYNIDVGNLEETEKVEIEHLTLNWKEGHDKREGKWVMFLWNAVCKTNMCHMVLSHKGNGDFYLIGKPVNIELVKYFVEQLSYKIKEIEKESWNQYDGPELRNKYRRGFYEGAVKSISEYLMEQFKQMTSEYSNLPVIVDKNKVQIRNYIDNSLGGSHQSKMKGGSSSKDGYTTGIIKGKSIRANKGLQNSALNQYLLK